MNKANLDKDKADISSPEEVYLKIFANKLATVLTVPMVIFLEGDLGAGKTAFARALLNALGYREKVKSPTYGLMELYQLEYLQVIHLDLYRIGDPGELEFLGLEDLIDENSIVLVEWPERGEGWLPEADFVFHFDYAGEGRELRWQALTEAANRVKSSYNNT